MNAPDIIQRVRACGYDVQLTLFGPVLIAGRSERIMPPRLLEDVKANRDSLVEFLTEMCGECGRNASDPEDRARLADPLYCDHGRSQCPYKP
ncbi:MAG: hypothetical protein K8U57_31385 [Planctomycetes bacterium]|nr:hypothetical protein [Planctomycetota bacterium]